RGCYGLEELNYDLFGGGVTSFTNFVIRAGQDQNASIIRNELCENLALAASDNIIGSRNRYCILFLDGKYSGIYALSEKLNEQHYANLAGVSKNSVVTMESEAPRDSDLFLDVFNFCAKNDMKNAKPATTSFSPPKSRPSGLFRNTACPRSIISSNTSSRPLKRTSTSSAQSNKGAQISGLAFRAKTLYNR
ncbi:MAG: CotH kinase family protein, partial [Eubacteriales bacterium]